VPRPKSEITKAGKTIGIRVTQSEYEEYKKLGAGKWLRAFLREHKVKEAHHKSPSISKEEK